MSTIRVAKITLENDKPLVVPLEKLSEVMAVELETGGEDHIELYAVTFEDMPLEKYEALAEHAKA